MTLPIKLKSRVITGSKPGPHLLITGGVHGDEFEPMAAIRRLITLIDSEQLRGRLTLVPIVNESAFLCGSRTADDEVDLARACPGRADGSITERVAHALSELIRSADFYIDLHSGGTALSLMPLAGYMLHPVAEVLEKQRQMARGFNLPIVWGTTAALNGRSLSVAREANIPAIYAEYLGGGRCSEEGIRDYVEGCLNVMCEIAMLDRELPKSRIKYMVEDNRPSAGHLQISHPAPETGFYEPAVTLGQAVEKGQLLGRVIADALGEQIHDVQSEHTGIVICLSTFSRVLKGNGVAVVLEIKESKSSAVA